MSTTRESSHVSRKTVTHSGGQKQKHLENNLDALLEDLQTTVTPGKTSTLTRTVRTKSPDMDFCTSSNSTKIMSEDSRAISPTRSGHRTLEKYVSTVPAGKPSGIPGLDDLDKELQDVQPGQSKTVAYREVTYHYNKDLNGQPMDSWKLDDLDKIAQTKSGTSLLDREYHDNTFEESRSSSRLRERSPEVSKKSHKEVHYSDSMTRTGSRQASPLPGSRHKEVYHHESSYRSEPRERTITTTVLDSSMLQEITTNRELITPPPVPANLAPGPNTRVVKTVKTYTYELPGSPEKYMSSSSLSKSGDKIITYTVPDASEKTVTYQVEKINEKRAGSPVRYVTSTPEVSTKSVHKEAKYYREERDFRTETPVTYYTATPTFEHRNIVTRNERFGDIGYGPKGPGDFTDHSEKTVIYQNQEPPVMKETTTKTVDRVEERFSSRNPPPTNYYCTAPPNTTTTTVYEKYENTYKSPESEVHIVRPYPAGGVKVYPSRPVNGEGPPKKFEDLMASFSDTEREVLKDIDKREKTVSKTSITKKEVDFVDGPDRKNVNPVYYPPGYELTRKEESSAVKEAGGGWEKSKAKYQYEASAKEKSKKRSGKAVVPVCLPLCCALPCSIM